MSPAALLPGPSQHAHLVLSTDEVAETGFVLGVGGEGRLGRGLTGRRRHGVIVWQSAGGP